MKTTKRFENALMKLYNAFHENRLNAMDCQACAVGNICNNSSIWRNYASFNTCDFTIEISKRDLPPSIRSFGYSKLEIANIEKIFIESCNFESGTKEQQFKGLCEVVEYLAELDNIPNPMDYTKLFETENDLPKYELILN